MECRNRDPKAMEGKYSDTRAAYQFFTKEAKKPYALFPMFAVSSYTLSGWEDEFSQAMEEVFERFLQELCWSGDGIPAAIG